MTATQFLAFMAAWTLAVAVGVDLVWTRHHRRRANSAESRARRLAATVNRLEHETAVRARASHPAYSSTSPSSHRPLRVVRGGETA